MFHYEYLSTVDRKKKQHNYKLPFGEAAPNNEEIVDLRIADQWSIVDLIDPTQLAALRKAFPKAKVPRAAKK